MLLYYFNNANLEGVRSHIDTRFNRMVKTQKVRLAGGEPPDVPLVKEAASPVGVTLLGQGGGDGVCGGV